MHVCQPDLKAIRVILWDVDDTILNFYEAQKNAIRSCFQKFSLGECSDEMLRDYDRINHRYWQALERGEITKPQVLEGRFVEFFQKYGISTDSIPAFNQEYQLRLGDTICFYPHVMDVLQSCKRNGILQFAVTNGTKAAQSRKLARSGLDKLLDGIFISEDVGAEKPSPVFFAPVYQEIQKKFPDIRLSEILIIGDSLTSDIQLGKNVGIQSCLFHPKPTEDASLKADLEISDYSKLLEILKNNS